VIAYFRSLEPCLAGMEACATAHYWARELIALGHRVKLMPPAYVKAYVERNKNDAAGAEAICEAVTRPSMRLVPVKDAEQQSVLMLHRGRSLLVRQRTMLVNALRAHLAEFGIVAPQGLRHDEILTETIAHQQAQLPELARSMLQTIVNQLDGTMARIQEIEGALGQVAPREPERWTRDPGPQECVHKVKAAPFPGQIQTTFRCCWPCGVVGDAPASSKRSGKSTGLTSAAHDAAGVL